MTAPSTGTQAAAAPQRTVADWVHIMHNATLALQDDPNNAKLHKIVQVAKQGLRTTVAHANDQEEAAQAPGAAGAAVVNFGQGASGGLAQTQALRTAMMAVPGGEAVMHLLGSTPEQYQDYLWKARMAQPGASAAGELTGAGMSAIIGGAPLAAAGAGPVLTGALMTGVPAGVQAGIEGGPVAGVAAGIPAALFGAAGGKIISKIPLARNVASRIMAKLMGTVPEGAALDAAEAGMRQALKKAGMASADIETVVEAEHNRMVQEMAKSVLHPEAPPAPTGAASTPAAGRAAADAAQEAQIRQALKHRNYGSPEQIDEFVRRWKASKAAMLPPPTTVPQVTTRAVQAEAFERAATEIPALKPPPPALSAQARPQEVPLVSQYRATIKQMEEHLGRELTGEERRIVAARFSTPHPGHPVWFGPGAPTE